MTTETGSDFQPAPAPPSPFSTESKNWGTISHLSAFVMFFGIPALVGPIAVWLIKKDDAYVEFHAKEALNFNISFMIYGIVAAISIIFLIGLLVLPAVLITWFVLVINGAIKASSGEYYRYPLTMRFVS
jgi:uncharacterized Tic20 family protein